MPLKLIIPMAALLLVLLVGCGGESNPTPSPTTTSAPSPTPSSRATSATEEPTQEQEACVIEAIGEQAGREVYSRQRMPTSNELDAYADCGINMARFTPGSELPAFDTLPEALAPARLGTVAWPDYVQGSSALFGRLPPEIAGHGIRTRFDPSGPDRFDTTYGEHPQTHGPMLEARVLDLAKGDFFPADTNAGQFVALFAQEFDWEVLASGREGTLAWVQIKTTGDTGEVTRHFYGMLWGNAPSSVVFGATANGPGELMALVEAMVSAAGR